MHISEGVMSAPVLVAGAILGAGGMYAGLRRLDPAQLPKTALMAAVFFVASLIHVPIGVSSAHLLLNGMIGLLLGWAAFPAIFVALALQAILFQFGGLLVLGLNTFDMAMPGVICYALFGRLAASANRPLAFAGGFATGLVGMLLSALFTACALALAGQEFVSSAEALFLSHVPIMFAEAAVTAVIVGFLGKVRPAMLQDARLAAAQSGRNA
ncbi:MAG: cobalt transporter CbiM [Desulfovibrionaceae bacterium]|nr:cobalt transporter CbiM [Desulfovibrionaceae bacterium]MBF0515038.1 cobalt transporter CbiM [Desulfovibrionaceae bacterium]